MGFWESWRCDFLRQVYVWAVWLSPTSTFGLKLLNHLKPGGNEPCSHTEADLTAGLLGKLWLWRGQQIWSWGGPTNYITFQNLFFFKCSNLSGKNCEILCIGGIGWARRKVSFYLPNNLDTNCHKILLKMIMLTMMASSIICLCSHKSRSLGMKAKSPASGQMHLLYSWTLDSDILGGHDNVLQDILYIISIHNFICQK